MQAGMQPQVGMQRQGMGTGAAVGLGVGALAAGGLAGYALGGGFSSGDSPHEEVPPFSPPTSGFLEPQVLPVAPNDVDDGYIENVERVEREESDDYLEQEAPPEPEEVQRVSACGL